jgi:hypothetical protein
MSNPGDLRLSAARMLAMAMRTGQSSLRPSNRRRLKVMKQRQCFIAKLSAVCVLLLGTTATNFAWAAKTASASHHSDRASTKHGAARGPITSHRAPVTSHSVPAPVTSRSAPAPVTGSATKSDWGPIDTRITVLNGPHSRASAKTQDWKKSNIARPLGTPRANYQVWKRSGEERVVKNAIGLPVRQPNASRASLAARPNLQ